MAGLTKIASLLTDALLSAQATEQQKLAQAIEDFVDQHPQAWKHLQASPYADLFDAIVQGCDAMPGLAKEMREQA